MGKALLNLLVFALLIAGFVLAANDGRLPLAAKPVHGADWCAEHQVKLSECTKCNPKLARGGTLVTREREPREGECPNTLVRITLPPDVARQAGLELAIVEARTVAETLRANAETKYPPSRYARVAPRIPGVIREVKAVLGQEVAAGAVLAVLESAEYGAAKSEYLQALVLLDLRRQTFEQEQALAEKKITAGRELLEARTSYEEAKLAVRRALQRLSSLGLAEDRVQALVAAQDTASRMEVVAPFAGVVLEAAAVIGETATPERPIFSVADVERLWLQIDVYEADVQRIEKDQRVVFTVEGLPGQRFAGKVLALGGEVDDRTRTVRVIAEVKNSQGLLRANLFGRAEVQIRPKEPRLLVPKEAVQTDGDDWLVFVSPTPNVFQARKVELGTAYENAYQVTGGLAAGEKVVTTGSFLLKTEVLRGQMGAG